MFNRCSVEIILHIDVLLYVFMGDGEGHVLLLYHLDPSSPDLFIYLFIYLFIVSLPFLGPLLWHIEISRLGVESEL